MSRRWRSTRRGRCATRSARTGGTTARRRCRRRRHPSARLSSDRTGPGRPRGPGPLRRCASGLEVLTGDDWAMLAGSRSRLSALARPWTRAPSRWRSSRSGSAWPCRPSRHPSGRRRAVPSRSSTPVLVGILNVTPDSFSDGGRFAGLDAALAHADALLADGRRAPRRRRRVHPAGPHRVRCPRTRSCGGSCR